MDFLDQGGVCGQCGVALTDVPNTPIEARIGCPSCGSTSRAIAVHLKETIQLSDYLSALQERKGEAVGFSESERQGRSSSATFQNDGWVDIAVIGSSPQGEEDTRAACQILKERLNAGGDNWDRIVLLVGKQLIVSSLTAKIPSGRSKSRFVRAVVSEDLWRNLNLGGSIHRVLSPADAASELRHAIEKKARDAKIPGNYVQSFCLHSMRLGFRGLPSTQLFENF